MQNCASVLTPLGQASTSNVPLLFGSAWYRFSAKLLKVYCIVVVQPPESSTNERRRAIVSHHALH